jgi:hypothetical protein
MSAFELRISDFGDGTFKEAAMCVGMSLEGKLDETAATNGFDPLMFKLGVLRELVSGIVMHHPRAAALVEQAALGLVEQVRSHDQFHRTRYATDELLRAQLERFDPGYGEWLRSQE